VGINWSGGANDGTTPTAVKWPTDFTLLGIVRDNALFNPTPILPVNGVNPAGTTQSTLTAPSTPGNYIVRVHVSDGTWSAIPDHETNFSDINVTVTAPLVETFAISGFKINNNTGLGVPGWTINLTNDTMTATNTTDENGMYMFTGLANGTYNVTELTQNGWTPVGATMLTVSVTGADVVNMNFTNTPPTSVAAPNLTLTLNNTMDGSSTPLINNITNITSAVLLDTSGNPIESATTISLDGMTAQFSLGGIMPGDYFIKLNDHSGALVPTRIDSNATDINQSVGRRLRNSVIGDISNPAYRIKSYPSEISSSHPVVNYITGKNESKYAFVIVSGSTNKIEVRVLNTSEELSNFSTANPDHDGYTDAITGLPVSFQTWILGDVKNPADPTGVAFLGNHGHLYNASSDICSGCHPDLNIKPLTFPPLTGIGETGWCFRCHNGTGGPSQGFVDPKVVVVSNGTIMGTVINASSGLGIENATVSADTQSNITDANGNYSISIAAGTYTVTASAAGYQTNATTDVGVTSGNVTIQNFALIPVPTEVNNVALTADALSKTTITGINATYMLTINNTGTAMDNYTLAIDNPDGATTAGLSTNLVENLAAGESAAVLLNVTNDNVGDFRVNVTATSQGDPTKMASVNTTTTVNVSSVINNVTLTADSLTKTTIDGINASYMLTVNNTGTAMDNYTLAIDNPDGATTASLSTNLVENLPAGESTTVLLNVTNENAGDFRVNVTATSQGDPTKMSSVNTTTTVNVFNVTLTADSLTKTTITGISASYMLTINNTGNVMDNYTLAIDNPDGATTASLSTNLVENLTAGENTTVLLNVTNENAGDFRVNVTATSQGDPRKMASVNTTTIVNIPPQPTSFQLTPSTNVTLKGTTISMAVMALNNGTPLPLFNGMANITITANNASAVTAPMNVTFISGNATFGVTSSIAQFVTVTVTNETITSSTEVAFADRVISLDLGWNLISIPNFADPSSVDQILKNVKNNGIVGFDPATKTFSTPSDLLPLYGYWINVTAPNQSIGFMADTNITSVPPSRNLFEGWNLIGVVGDEQDTNLDAGLLFQPLQIGGQPLYSFLVSNKNPRHTYEIGVDLTDRTPLNEGQGYWLFMKTMTDTNKNSVVWAGKPWLTD
jgi:hypothetical protein